MELLCFLTITSTILRTKAICSGQGGCRDLEYLHCVINKALSGHVIKTFKVLVPASEPCQRKCFLEPLCVSYNLGPVEGNVRTCELSSTDHGTYPAQLMTKEGFEYCPIKNPCLSRPCSTKKLCFPDFACNTFSCRDGDWTQWSTWSPCSCRSRTTRTRSCVNPFLNVSAMDCPGPAEEVQPSCPPVDGCSHALGMQDGGCIKDSQITASTTKSDNCITAYARLHHQRKFTYDSSWCAKVNKIGEYVQIDLGFIKTVTKVATQGRDITSRNQWVTEYTLSYSNDNKNWTNYVGDDISTKRFVGNTDKTTVVTNVLPVPIRAQYIRVMPHSWSEHICMRLELYGC